VPESLERAGGGVRGPFVRAILTFHSVDESGSVLSIAASELRSLVESIRGVVRTVLQIDRHLEIIRLANRHEG
jgi:hypothetical protein